MSSIKTAFTTVKNFFSNIVGKQESTEEGHAQSGRFRKRPAPAPSIYEPEITDDEDDTPGFPYYRTPHYLSSKRLRVDSQVEFEMSSNKRGHRSPHYPTRGSGIPPGVEGAKPQPWEFDFRSTSKGPLTSGSSNDDTGRPDVPGTSRASSNPSTSRKNVEIITLDDDNDNPRASTSTMAQQARTQSTSSRAPGRNEAIIMKPRVSSPMKASKRDSNPLSKCLGDFSRKILRTTHSTAFRLQEKQQYRQLLMAYNVLSSSGTYEHSALTKSKVSQQQLQVMYNKFGTSPTEGTVTLRVNGRSLATSNSGGQEILSSADRSALVPHPRLFSTSTEIETFVPSPKRKAIEYRKEPDVIDLEKEPSTSKAIGPFVSPITPVASRRSLISSTPAGSPIVGNFTNLEDALNCSGLSATVNDPNPEDEVLAIEDSSQEDGDISIIAEKIVNKSRSKSTNTLALEQTLCPYVDKQWLTDSKTSWRDNQKHREMRIQEESETMNILKRESTLEKDLEEKIRKKLTLTEIIVLEEPPAELPEMTPEMWKTINYAKARGNDSEVLAEVRLLKDNIKITRGDVKTLGPLQWLNDNIINTYMGLIVLRGQKAGNKKVYAFQTFFYPKLLKEGYSNSLKRWTRKDDLFAYDLIILPIHLGLHWCLACIDNCNKTIKYYDSLGGTNDKCLHSLLDYISREMKERKQVDLDKSTWTLQNMKEIPQQQNGSDCGMFSCKFAEYLSREAKLTFKQEDMQYYRDRMIYELIKSELMSP